jgi:hypothetical protein
VKRVQEAMKAASRREHLGTGASSSQAPSGKTEDIEMDVLGKGKAKAK